MADELEIPTLEQQKSEAGSGGGRPPIDGDKLFRSGITKKTKQFEKQITEELAGYNVKPVIDGKGRVDLRGSLAALAKAGQPEAAAKLEQRYAAQIAELQHENDRLNGELQKTRITATVREKIAALNPINLDDAVDLFLMRYNIRHDEDTGSLMVCDAAGNPLHDPVTAVQMTVEMAAQKFFVDKPGLFTKATGNGLQGLGSMKGSPRLQSNEDLSQQIMEAVSAGDTTRAKALKNEAAKRLQAARNER